MADQSETNGDKNELLISKFTEEEEVKDDVVSVDPDTADPSEAWYRLGEGQNIEDVEPQEWTTPVSEDTIRFVCLSDTHSRVEDSGNFYVPDGDVLLFAGDMTMAGSYKEIIEFNRFIGKLPHRHKIVIAGNHDFDLDENYETSSLFLQKDIAKELTKYGVNEVSELLTNCTFIQDEMVDVAGIKIYGSPWVPAYGSPAFSCLRGQQLLDKWNKIPQCTDILLTHAPPLGIGDTVPGGIHCGCVELLNTVQHRVKPKYHVFGHIHEGYGMYTDGSTVFINASTCAKGYKPVNRPIMFDVQIQGEHTKTDSLIHCATFRSENDASSKLTLDQTFDPFKKES